MCTYNKAASWNHVAPAYVRRNATNSTYNTLFKVLLLPSRHNRKCRKELRNIRPTTLKLHAVRAACTSLFSAKILLLCTYCRPQEGGLLICNHIIGYHKALSMLLSTSPHASQKTKDTPKHGRYATSPPACCSMQPANPLAASQGNFVQISSNACPSEAMQGRR